jgi:hypothetical protein
MPRSRGIPALLRSDGMWPTRTIARAVDVLSAGQPSDQLVAWLQVLPRSGSVITARGSRAVGSAAYRPGNAAHARQNAAAANTTQRCQVRSPADSLTT